MTTSFLRTQVSEVQLSFHFYHNTIMIFCILVELVRPLIDAHSQWLFSVTDVKQYPNLVKTLVFLLQTWKPKSIDMKNLPTGTSLIADAAPQASDHLGSNLKGEVQNHKRSNVVPVPLALPKPCFLMSWRRRIPKEDEDLFFQGCIAAGLCVADYGARVYCIYPQLV